MFQFLNVWKPKETELYLRGHDKWVFDVKAHPNGEWVLSAGFDNTVRLFSSITGKCMRLFEGHRLRAWRVAVADHNTVLSVSDDKTLRAWSISSGSLTNVIKFEENLWNITKLDDGLFAVGTISGKVHILTKDLNEFSTRFVFQAHEEGINYISSSHDRFGTASLDFTAKIWDMNTYECLAILTGHKSSCRAISIGRSFIATSSFDGTILVYDAGSYNVTQKITTHQCYVRSLLLVGPEENVLSSAEDRTIRLHSSQRGDLMWTKQLGEPAICSTVLKDGRIATGLSTGKIIVYGTPKDISPHIKPLPVFWNTSAPVKSQPLQDALVSCASGYSCPRDHCRDLIKYEACRASYEEWCSAHRILMLAVEDGDVIKNTEFNDEHSWWYDNLYVAVRDIELAQDQYVRVKQYLSEAKRKHVLESVDAVLTALHVTRDVRENTRMMERAGTLILERILKMEDQLEQLREAYNRYVHSQRKSQLIGIALQVIPIAGGAVAGALSAGSEIISGLSVKDVTDYAMGIGTNFAQSQIDAVSDRILRQAAESLSPASVREMALERRGKLEEALRYCGIDIDVMHQLFVERIEERNAVLLSVAEQSEEVLVQDSGALEGVIGVKIPEESGSRSEDSDAFADTVDTSNNRGDNEAGESVSGTPEEISSSSIVEEAARSTRNAESNTLSASFSKGNFVDFARLSIAQLKLVNISAKNVANLSQENIARLWAAHIYRFDEGEREKCSILTEGLLSTMRENDVYGPELVDRRLFSVKEVMQIALEDLGSARDIELSLGLRARMKRFLLDVSLNAS